MTEQTINWAAVAVTAIPAICLLVARILTFIERQRLRAMGIPVPVPPDNPAGPAAMILVVVLGLLLSDLRTFRAQFGPMTPRGVDYSADTRPDGLPVYAGAR